MHRRFQSRAQLLISGRDWVVRTKPQVEFFARLGATVKEQHTFHQFYHDILGEKDRRLALEKVRNFVLTAFAAPCQQPRLLDADKIGYTKSEFDTLSRPLPLFSRKRLGFGLVKLGMKVGGLFFQRNTPGVQTGFDSGGTLDYVYRNRASGATPIFATWWTGVTSTRSAGKASGSVAIWWPGIA